MKKHGLKRGLRTIIVNNQTFLWKVEHLHLQETDYSKPKENIALPKKYNIKHGSVIYVNNQALLWNGEHKCFYEYVPKCMERVTIFKENHKQSPLRLWFREKDNELLHHKKGEADWIVVGYPDSGVIAGVDYTINLNRPVVIAELIDYFLKNEWQPNIKKPCEIKNALTYLEKITLTNGH